MIKPSGLLQTHHVADILACSNSHVRDLIRQGKLAAVKVGKKIYRVKREEVLRFQEENQVDPKTFFE